MPTQQMEHNYQIEINFQLFYPDIYYKLQPHVMSACDHIDSNTAMPSQDMIESLSDKIHSEVCHMYPEVAAYAAIQANKKKCVKKRPCCCGKHDTKPSPGPEPFFRHSNQSQIMTQAPMQYPMYNDKSGNKEMLRDFINILLLNEFYRRRKGNY